MKNIVLFIILLSIADFSAAQFLVFNYEVSKYPGGTNVSCNGAADGWINLDVKGGRWPYIFRWSNGSKEQNNVNLKAGTYSVEVTDMYGLTGSFTLTLTQPERIKIKLLPGEYERHFNISAVGKHDGYIETEVSGGAPGYKYYWSNGVEVDKISELSPGTYSLTVTDTFGCAVKSSVILYSPRELRIVNSSVSDYNGYNVSKFNGNDGSISILVAGGIPGFDGYKYFWNNGSSQSSISGLMAGHYIVVISDNIGNSIMERYELTQPSK